MYAIVDIGGVQYKVSKSMKIHVPKMEVEPGKSVELDRVLLLVDKDDVKVGKPTVADASIVAKVISHGKDKKVIVFKKKRKKNYRVLRGHRQEYTELQIDQIMIGKTAAAKTEKTAAPAEPKAKDTAPAKPAVKPPAKSASKTPAKSTVKTQAKKAPATKTASAKPKTVKKTGASRAKKE
jgi:large subunit ribosomal protein L21